MRVLSVLSVAVLAAMPAAASRSGKHHAQAPIISSKKDKGVGHFSEWSRATKKAFLIDWQAGKESEWTFVMGNEGGDLDSMTAALAWAYHLGHSTENTANPIKAIALLQTPTHALDLRPENQLALKNSRMTSGHEDLLTRDELPEDPETLSPKLHGIVLVDHAAPLRKWQKAKILSIFDHHVDRGTAPDAKPRIFETTASCTTIVARQMLDELEKMNQEYHMPHELLRLILGAIAIDSSGLDEDSSSEADIETAARVLKRSDWNERDLTDVMEDIYDALSDAKKDLGHLGVRDLLRRDWKSDLVDTISPRTPTVSLGFASVPYSLDYQINKSEFEELFDWFAIHAAWTAEASVDVSVVLNNYKIYEKGEKKKIREIVVVVRDDVRIDQDQANSLFQIIYDALTTNSSISLKPWHRVDELAPRQMVWTQQDSDAGRKVIRPIVEDAVMEWD